MKYVGTHKPDTLPIMVEFRGGDYGQRQFQWDSFPGASERKTAAEAKLKEQAKAEMAAESAALVEAARAKGAAEAQRAYTAGVLDGQDKVIRSLQTSMAYCIRCKLFADLSQEGFCENCIARC